MNKIISGFLLLLLINCSYRDNKYPKPLDNNFPDTIPKVFAHNFISKDTVAEFGSIFNKDLSEFYFAVDSKGKADIRSSSFVNGEWTNPKVILQDSIYSFNDPFLSPDETRLYYISNRPRNSFDTIKDYDIWYSEISSEGLLNPVNAGKEINTDGNEFYISFTEDGSMYFASNKENYLGRKHNLDIYKSQFNGKQFDIPIKLGEAINSRNYEADVFIAPDESYIIYCSARRSGLGRGDLYISFKDENNDWTQSVNMGEPINSENHEICPFVSPDGKYLYYTSNQDIYWVSTKIFDTYR